MIKSCFWSLMITYTVSATAQKNNELKLWYNTPAAKWTDALPLGNGRIGAMIFGGVLQDRIQFNEETLWTGGPRDYNRPGAANYLPELRKLIAEGKQAEAEKLATEKFLGMKSNEGDRATWLAAMRELKGINGNPALPDFNDSAWKTIEIPTYEGWETLNGMDGMDGALWFRTTFDLPAEWSGKDLVLDLNRIRDQDFTYVNGKLVGTTETAEPRKYTIPKEVLVNGKNTIAIQVLNYFDKGGIAGYKDTSRHIGIYEAATENNKISLNGKWKYFVQDDEPPAAGRYQADYQPFGDLWLNFKDEGEVTDYKRELDISNAVSQTSYSVNGIHFTREYFVSAPAQLLAIHLASDKTGAINFEAVLSSPHKNFSVKKITDSTIALSLKVRNGVLKGESYVFAEIKNGTLVIEDNKLFISNADEATLYVSAGTNFKNYKDVSGDPAALCKKALLNIAGKSYSQLKAAHIAEYQKYFNTLSIDLGKGENDKLPTNERIEKFAASRDPSFVGLYLQYGRYLLISSSRPGTQPANLQGIWNDLLTPPWGSKYTTNINAEMNYWPAELLNLSPMHQPFLKMVEELSVTGKQTAKIHYDAPGWVLHHNTDLWRGTAPINAANHGIWVTGGAWMASHLWEHYLFTQDIIFLKKAYPVLKSAAMFFNSFLVQDSVRGWLISTPSNSPEHGGLVAGPTMDHQIIRELFKSVIKASEILNTDTSFRKILKEKYSKIAPNQVGKHGQLQEWLEDKDDPKDTHRHVSHLWGVHPGNDINWDESPEIMKAARQSLLYRGDAATGWSLAWKINFWARFKDGDHAYKLIQMLISPAEKNGAGSYKNLFDAHPPFQIDGNFGGAAGIGEMLLQSHTKYIDILPALPSDLPSGEIKGICARGGFVFNIKWKDGKLDLVEIVSKAGQTCILRYNGELKKFKTQPGKTYVVQW